MNHFSSMISAGMTLQPFQLNMKWPLDDAMQCKSTLKCVRFSVDFHFTENETKKYAKQEVSKTKKHTMKDVSEAEKLRRCIICNLTGPNRKCVRIHRFVSFIAIQNDSTNTTIELAAGSIVVERLLYEIKLIYLFTDNSHAQIYAENDTNVQYKFIKCCTHRHMIGHKCYRIFRV